MKVRTRTSLVTIFSVVAVFSLAAGTIYHLNQPKVQNARMDKPIGLSRNEIIELNNQGVRALNETDFKEAISCFQKALREDPNYEIGRKNLAIAYNNYGLRLTKEPILALKQFYIALSYDPPNSITRSNIDDLIRFMKRDPNDFEDRLALAEEFTSRRDAVSAAWEYRAALALRDDPKVREQLKKEISKLPPGSVFYKALSRQ